jgi:hypothetical protein
VCCCVSTCGADGPLATPWAVDMHFNCILSLSLPAISVIDTAHCTSDAPLMHDNQHCMCAVAPVPLQLVQSPSLPPQGVALELVYLPTSDLAVSSTVLQELAGAVVAALPPDTPGRWAGGACWIRATAGRGSCLWRLGACTKHILAM